MSIFLTPPPPHGSSRDVSSYPVAEDTRIADWLGSLQGAQLPAEGIALLCLMGAELGWSELWFELQDFEGASWRLEDDVLALSIARPLSGETAQPPLFLVDVVRRSLKRAALLDAYRSVHSRLTENNVGEAAFEFRLVPAWRVLLRG